MKIRMVEERTGEFLGPTDWGYDFAQHSAVNPTCVEEGVAAMRMMEAEPRTRWGFCPSGFSVFEVVHVGMYDGWPYWRPTPAVGYLGPLGIVEWAFFYDLSPRKISRLRARFSGSQDG